LDRRRKKKFKLKREGKEKGKKEKKGEGLVRLGGGCFLVLRGWTPLILASTAYTTVIGPTTCHIISPL